MIDKFRNKYSFLSNMYPSLVIIDGSIYPSAEHAFQAMKCVNDDDKIAISVCRSPEEAKKAGKLVKLRSDWESAKIGVMLDILRAKFNNPELRDKLKATGEEELIEGNTWGDTFWGMCKGHGENNLGKLLMQVRKEIA